ncbi:hypothetical protein F4810DRAFT_241128 [Camillea tinctor]|nr:hypothetical protein F4810DRAFT_241128 [Camillea tinctor]
MQFQDTTEDGFFRRSFQYEFVTEMDPGVWKIYRKKDRMDFLALDMTDQLFVPTDRPGVVEGTPLNTMLSPHGHNLIESVLGILNHENLVSLVDVFATQVSKSGKFGRMRWYTVWNYCDAGNLGNLLVPEGKVPSRPGKKDRYPGDKEPTFVITDLLPDVSWYEGFGTEIVPDVQQAIKAAPKDAFPGRKFLPESFCWYVLCSLLKALAWLHDGATKIIRDSDTGEIQMDYADDDWQPMLHRNINPENVFLGHPRRGEWYGACKLGNYRDLVVTGYLAGEDGYPLVAPPLFAKPIAPPIGKKFTPLTELILQDTKMGSTYPYMPDQPYTMVSEYRAVGEIIQAMMVPPGSVGHIESIRKFWVVDNLRDLDYSFILKNFVVRLMQVDPWKDPKGDGGLDTAYTTSRLCLEAWNNYNVWKRGNPEGQNWCTTEVATEKQREMDALVQSAMVGSTVQMQRVMKEMDPSKLTPPSKTI